MKVCLQCALDLKGPSRKHVSMPRFALANDNWIGRQPFPLHPGGEPLREMEVKSLARGRMCVKKIIAEPEKKGPRDTKQGGLVGNAIAFPQAKVSFMKGQQLPPTPEDAEEFMRDSVIIAMVGADVEDLHNAKWAEVRRNAYVEAGEFLTSHDVFYSDMAVDASAAAAQCAIVRLQLVPRTLLASLARDHRGGRGTSVLFTMLVSQRGRWVRRGRPDQRRDLAASCAALSAQSGASPFAGLCPNEEVMSRRESPLSNGEIACATRIPPRQKKRPATRGCRTQRLRDRPAIKLHPANLQAGLGRVSAASPQGGRKGHQNRKFEPF